MSEPASHFVRPRVDKAGRQMEKMAPYALVFSIVTPALLIVCAAVEFCREFSQHLRVGGTYASATALNLPRLLCYLVAAPGLFFFLATIWFLARYFSRALRQRAGDPTEE